MIVSGITIQILYSKQDRIKASITKVLIFKVIRLYFYLMMFYQTIYAGKLLLDSTMLKLLGWYAFGFLLIFFLRANRVGMFDANLTSHSSSNMRDGSNAIPISDTNSRELIKNPKRFKFTQMNTKQLLSMEREFPRELRTHLPMFGISLIKHPNYSDGYPMICEVERGKLFHMIGIQTAVLLISISNETKNLRYFESDAGVEGLIKLESECRNGDKLEMKIVVEYQTNHEQLKIYNIVFEGHTELVD